MIRSLINSGVVSGPETSLANSVAIFEADGSTKLISTQVIIDPSGNISTPGTITGSGIIIGSIALADDEPFYFGDSNEVTLVYSSVDNKFHMDIPSTDIEFTNLADSMRWLYSSSEVAFINASGALSVTSFTSESAYIGTGGSLSPDTALQVDGAPILCPRLTTTQRDALSPLAGMFIYNTTESIIQFYNNSSWVSPSETASVGSAGDVQLSDGSGNFISNTLNFTSNVLNIANASGAYHIDGNLVLNASTLGSGITSSSLTSLGIITNLQCNDFSAGAAATGGTIMSVNESARRITLGQGGTNYTMSITNSSTSLTATSHLNFDLSTPGTAKLGSTTGNATDLVLASNRAAIISIDDNNSSTSASNFIVQNGAANTLLQVTSAGLTTIPATGSIGGTTVVNASLLVGANLGLDSTSLISATNLTLGTVADSYIRFITNSNSEIARFIDGAVGIGTTTPGSALHVVGVIDATPAYGVHIGASGSDAIMDLTAATSGDVSSVQFGYVADPSTGILRYNNSAISSSFDLDIDGATSLTILPAGILQLNELVPLGDLVTSATNYITMRAESPSGDFFLRHKNSSGTPGFAGTIYSDNTTSHWFIRNVSTTLTFGLSTTSTDSPTLATSSTQASLSSSGFDIPGGNEYFINSTSVLNETTLGSGVINSSLQSVGTLSSLTVGSPQMLLVNSSGVRVGAGSVTHRLSVNDSATFSVDVDTTNIVRIGSLTEASARLQLESLSDVRIDIDSDNSGTSSTFSIYTNNTTELFTIAETGQTTISSSSGDINNATMANSHLLIGTTSAGLGLDTNEMLSTSSLSIGTLGSAITHHISGAPIHTTTTTGLGIFTVLPENPLQVVGSFTPPTTAGIHAGIDSIVAKLAIISSGSNASELWLGNTGDVDAAILNWNNSDLSISISGSNTFNITSSNIEFDNISPLTTTGGGATDLITLAAVSNENYFMRYRNAPTTPGYAGVMFSNATTTHWSIYNSAGTLFIGLDSTVTDTPAYDDASAVVSIESATVFKLNSASAAYYIGSDNVLSATTLGSTVVNSSLTSLGTLSSLTISGNLIVDTDTLFVDASADRVGINIATPNYEFDVRNAGNTCNFAVDLSNASEAIIGTRGLTDESLTIVATDSMLFNTDINASGSATSLTLCYGTLGSATNYAIFNGAAEENLVMLRNTTTLASSAPSANVGTIVIGSTYQLGIDSANIRARGAFKLISDVSLELEADSTSVMTSNGTSLVIPIDLAVDTDTLFVDVSTDRIGINTSSPSYDLDLQNTSNNNDFAIDISSATGPQIGMRGSTVKTTTFISSGELVINSDSAGIGTSGAIRLSYGDLTMKTTIALINDNLQENLIMMRNTTTLASSAPSDTVGTIVIGSSYQLGIDSANIRAKGAFKLISDVSLELEANSTSIMSSNGTSLSIPVDLAVDTDTLFVDVSTDRVGINTSSPGFELDVHNAGGTNNFSVDLSSTTGAVIGTRGGTSKSLTVSATGALNINSDGSALGLASDISFTTGTLVGPTTIAVMSANQTLNMIKTTTLLSSNVVSSSNYGILVGSVATGLAIDAANIRSGSNLKVISTSGTIEFEANSNSAVFIDDNKVGFGTSSPESAITVAGPLDLTPTVSGVHLGINSNTAVTYLYGASGGDAELRFSGSDGTNEGRIIYDVNTEVFSIFANSTLCAKLEDDGLKIDELNVLTTGTPRHILLQSTTSTERFMRFRMSGSSPNRGECGICLSNTDTRHWFIYQPETNVLTIAFSTENSSQPTVGSATSTLELDTSGNLSITSRYEISGITVLSSTTLGSGVVNSSLTSLGAQAATLNMNSNDISSANEIDCRNIIITSNYSGGGTDGLALQINNYNYTLTDTANFSTYSIGLGSVTGTGTVTKASTLRVAGAPIPLGGLSVNTLLALEVVSGASLFGGNVYSTGDVAVGATSVSSGASLDLASTTKGLLLPRLTTTAKNAISGDGMLCFDTDLNELYIHSGSWKPVSTIVIPGSSGDVLLSSGSGDPAVDNLNFASNILNITNSSGLYRINGTTVISASTLGGGVINSFLRNLGTQNSNLAMGGNDITGINLAEMDMLNVTDSGSISSVVYTRSFIGNGTASISATTNTCVINMEGDVLTAASSITVPIASTLCISNVPTAGTNVSITEANALYVSSGTTRLDDDLVITGALFVDQSTPSTRVTNQFTVVDGSNNNLIFIGGDTTLAQIGCNGSLNTEVQIFSRGDISILIDWDGNDTSRSLVIEQGNGSYDAEIIKITQQGVTNILNTSALSISSISGAKFVIGDETTGLGFSHNQIYTGQSTLELGLISSGTFKLITGGVSSFYHDGSGTFFINDPNSDNTQHSNAGLAITSANNNDASLYIIESAASGISDITNGAGLLIRYDGGSNTISFNSYITGSVYTSFRIKRDSTPQLICDEDIIGYKHAVMDQGITVGNLTDLSSGQLLMVKQTLDGATNGSRTSAGQASLEIVSSSSSNSFSMGFATGATTALQMWYGTSPIAYINSSTNNGELTFTGQHRCQVCDESITEQCYGLIVIATEHAMNLDGSVKPSINEYLPFVCKARADRDIRVFGVISTFEDVHDGARMHSSGAFSSLVPSVAVNDTRLFVNSIGEGGIWVTNKNGPLSNGDYIEASSVAGYGQRSNSDQLHNYTVAKATVACDFSTTQVPRRVPNLTRTVTYKQSQVYEKIKEEYEHKDIRDVDGKKVQIVTIRTREVDIPKKIVYPLFDVDGNDVGVHEEFMEEEVEVVKYELNYDAMGMIEFKDEIDEDGNVVYDYPFETRWVDSSGMPITEEEYDTRLSNGDAVYIAQFIGCTYHCG